MMALTKPSSLQTGGSRRRHERGLLEAVLKCIPDAVIGADLDGRIRLFNPAAERMFGHNRASVQGEPVEMLMPERLRSGHHDAMLRFAKSEGDSRMMGLRRLKGEHSEGKEIDLEGIIGHVQLPQEKWLLVCLHDVSERVQDESQLQQSHAQLSELTKKMMSQERVLVKRLAQTLHDQLGQTLAAIRMCHDTMLTVQSTEIPPDLQRLHERLGNLIGQANMQIRQVLVDLRPPLLYEQGLCAAIDNELRNRAQTAPQVDVCVQLPDELLTMRWPADVEYAAFMVVREAVENALRHSGAKTITVDLSGNALALDLTVDDNGVGFASDASQRVGHLGLMGMQERAQAVGASVSCALGQSAGTRVSFHWKGAL